MNKVTFGKTVFEPQGQTRPVSEITEAIRNGEYGRLIKEIRDAPSEERKQALKKDLPWFNMGLFRDNQCKNDALLSTKHMIFDIDKKGNPLVSFSNGFRKKMSSYPYIQAVFLSPSGQGAKVICELPQLVKTDKEYKAFWKAGTDFFLKELGLRNDPATKDVRRICYLSYDPEIYADFSKKPLPIKPVKDDPSPAPKDFSGEKDELSEVYRAIDSFKNTTQLDRSTWYGIGCTLREKFGDIEGRNLFNHLSINNFYPNDTNIEKTWEEVQSRSGGEGMTLGTIFKFAQQNGFTFSKIYKAGPAKTERSESQTVVEYRRTDMGNAERLVGKFGHKIRYCTPRSKWLTWAETHWQWDEKTKIEVMAKLTVRDIIAEAMTADGEKFKEIAQHAARSENLARVRAMITLAQSEPEIPILPGELDRNPWLLNVKNGTIDLRTGTIREQRKADMITRYIDVQYNPEAECPTWIAFLDRVMGGNDQLIDFLHRSVGYSLSGDIREQCLFFNYGKGANGKSTFMETINRLLGPYSKNTRPETFMLKSSDGVNNDLAELQNVRLVAAVELEEGKRLAEVLTKQISGGDTIKARYLYEEFFEFRPQFKLWLCGNHKPQIRGTDHAIWRRIRLIPWTITIPDDEQDRGLLAKLTSEWPGILAWAVQGCLLWQRDGLTAPDEVMAATASYRKEQDILGDFFESCISIDKGHTVTVKELYEAYVKFCDDNGEGIRERLGKKKFNDRVTDRGFDSYRAGRNVLTWIGLDVQKE